jgi:hypothetical protein
VDNSGELSLGMSAEDFYNEHKAGRTGPVNVGRRLSDITLPSLFPPEHWDTGDELETTNQSIAAYLINSLTNGLTLAALPPNLPMCKFDPVEEALADDIQADPELWSQTTYSLSRREATHRSRMSRTDARTAYGRSMKLQIVTGNACTLWTDLDHPRTYSMHHYVVVRDANGAPLVTVLKDSVSLATADDDIADAAKAHWTREGKDFSGSPWKHSIDIYHVQKLVKKGEKLEWLYWQEVEGGTVVEDSEAWAPHDAAHMMPAGLIHEPGSDWCLPYCLDYEGDLQSLENLEAACQDSAAAIAWFLFLVDPTGQTSIRDVQKADNLEVIPGRADDVTTMQTQKAGDMQAVSSKAEQVARRLGMAFAAKASIQRDAERVTAEEWQTLTQELDKALGGLYTEISRGTQRWFVMRMIHLHQIESPKLKPLPPGLVQVGVTTGVDSIGQNSDHANLIGWAREGVETLGPEAFSAEINRSDYLRRTAAYRGVKTDGLVKTDQQKSQDQAQAIQQQQQQTLLEQGTGPIAKEGAGAIAEMMKQQQQQEGSAENG